MKQEIIDKTERLATLGVMLDPTSIATLRLQAVYTVHFEKEAEDASLMGLIDALAEALTEVNPWSVDAASRREDVDQWFEQQLEQQLDTILEQVTGPKLDIVGGQQLILPNGL